MSSDPKTFEAHRPTLLALAYRMLGDLGRAEDMLLTRARENVASGRRDLETSREDHSRLLLAFVQAATEGDEAKLLALLTEDAVFIADGGPQGQKYGRLRSVGRPVAGRERIAARVKLFARQDVPRGEIRQRILNGEPAIVSFRDGRAFSAILIAPEDGKIARVYLRLDAERLRRVGGAS